MSRDLGIKRSATKYNECVLANVGTLISVPTTRDAIVFQAFQINAPLNRWAVTISGIALATGSYVFNRLGNRVLAHSG